MYLIVCMIIHYVLSWSSVWSLVFKLMYEEQFKVSQLQVSMFIKLMVHIKLDENLGNLHDFWIFKLYLERVD